MIRFRALQLTFSIALFAALAVSGQSVSGQSGGAGRSAPRPCRAVVLKGKLERIKVHGKSLVGNLLKVRVSGRLGLPAAQLSHGSDAPLSGRLSARLYRNGPELLRHEPAAPPARRRRPRVHQPRREGNDPRHAELHECVWWMHVANSPTTGFWEDYVADDLVASMDKNCRFEARARGLGGHSMGGYGTFKIAMKRPDVFSAIYALSSCCLNEDGMRPGRGGQPSAAESITSIEEARGNRGAQGSLARAAAWAPNPGIRLSISISRRRAERWCLRWQ